MNIGGERTNSNLNVRRVILTTGPQLHPLSNAPGAPNNYYCLGLDMKGFQIEIDLQAYPANMSLNQIAPNQVWWVEKRTSLYRLYLYGGTYDPTTRQINSTGNLPTDTTAKYYANYYSTKTQSAPLANTPYATTYNVTTDANGFYVDATGSQITAMYAGTYQFIFTAQIINYNSSGSATNNLSFWSRMNGIDVPWSAGEYTAFSKGGGVTPGLVVGWNLLQK